MTKSSTMSNRLKAIDSSQPIRAISLDGGGIYGLTTALLLRQLCEQDHDFLTKDQVYLFSGTSAGAVNALLLANKESPRDAVLSGELEKFWQDPRVYASHITKDNFYNPMSWVKEYYSNLGIGSWFASEPFRELLTETFGTKTLEDLPNKVMISTFNLYGKEIKCHRQWLPKLYYNFPALEPDRKKSIVDIAYAAGTPPGARDIKNGAIDGGLFVPNPAVNTIAKILEQARHFMLINLDLRLFLLQDKINHLYDYAKESDLPVKPNREEVEQELKNLFDEPCIKICLNQILHIIVGKPELEKLEYDSKKSEQLKTFIIKIISEEAYKHLESESLANAIKNTQLLSVGVGEKKPAYWLKDFSMGFSQFNKYPTNPLNWNFWQPDIFLALDAPSENSEYVCSQAIGEFYHRLNPPLFGAPDSLPTLPATFMAKNRFIKDLVIEQIKCKVDSQTAKDSIKQTLKYLEKWKPNLKSTSRKEIEKLLATAREFKAKFETENNNGSFGVEIAQMNVYIAELELEIEQITRQGNQSQHHCDDPT